MKHRTELSEINITPLLDVLLILVAVLLLALPAMIQSLSVNLPVTGVQPAAEKEKERQVAKLYVEASGVIRLGDTRLDKKEVASAIPKGSVVELYADESLAYARIVEILDILRAAGHTQVSLMTKPTNNQGLPYGTR